MKLDEIVLSDATCDYIGTLSGKVFSFRLPTSLFNDLYSINYKLFVRIDMTKTKSNL